MALDAKDPDHDTEYAIDARSEVIVELRRDWPYDLGAIAKSKPFNGFYLECTQAGETEFRSPTLPSTDGATVRDGSVMWTVRHPSSSSLPSISSVSWAVSPAGLTVASERTELGI